MGSITALDEAVRLGIPSGAFGDLEERVLAVLEEFSPETGTDGTTTSDLGAGDSNSQCGAGRKEASRLRRRIEARFSRAADGG